MVRTAGKNGRTRRSGGKSRADRSRTAAAVAMTEEQNVSSEDTETKTTETTVVESASGSEISDRTVEQDLGKAEGETAPGSDAGVDAADALVESVAECLSEDVSPVAGRGPGELDMLRGELFSEELEQNAVEQMFQWEREKDREKGKEDGPELSGGALLEAVHHGRYVAGLSLTLFESLAPDFGLTIRWARLLIQAALWHDLGFAAGGRRRHHKRSMEIIEENACLTLSFGVQEAERPLVALLARYHRRAWPSMKHRRFAALSEEDRRSLAGAAALLRLADALDYTHRGAVEELRVEVRRRKVRLVCFGAESCRKECRRALKKGDLFEKLHGGKLEVVQGKEGDRDAR